MFICQVIIPLGGDVTDRNCHGYSKPAGKYCGLGWGWGTGWRIHTPTKPVPASRVQGVGQIYFIFNFFVHIYIFT